MAIGLVAALTSFNVYGSDANFTPVLHLSLPVLSVFLQTCLYLYRKTKNACSRVKNQLLFLKLYMVVSWQVSMLSTTYVKLKGTVNW